MFFFSAGEVKRHKRKTCLSKFEGTVVVCCMLDVDLTAWSNDESNVAHRTYTQYLNMIYLTCSGRSKQ